MATNLPGTAEGEQNYNSIPLWVVLVVLTYIISIIIYRLHLSPLARFPGPKIAAATHYYEFYYNYWCQGKYIYKIEEFHNKYGPIVRVNPDLLSIKDPDAFNEIYVTEGKRKTQNFQSFAQGLGFDGSHFLTEDHTLHRRRRRPLEPYFSRSGVLRLQPLLAEAVRKLELRFDAVRGTDTVIRLDHAYFALAGDIVGKLCWADKKDLLDDPNFGEQWYNLIHGIIRSIYIFQGFPWLARLFHYIPKWVVLMVMPQGRVFDEFDEMTFRNVAIAKKAKIDHDKRDPFRRQYPSLFHWMVNSDMPELELSDNRLAKEAQVIQSAGSTSTARTLSHITYYILATPRIQECLKTELQQAVAGWPDRVPSWVDLQGLEYLQAVVKEGLRHSFATMHPLPRVSPDMDIQYKQWRIPAGTAVGISAYFMHTDPEVYATPFDFIPERWLGDIHPNMNRNFVPFAKGSRNCLGQNLAQAEMSLAIAILFRPGAPKLELFETNHTDTDHIHDFVVPLPRLDTKGIRVKVGQH